jgi:hypothetical protein
VVTKAIGPHELAYGNPAEKHGYVCMCGARLKLVEPSETTYR